MTRLSNSATLLRSKLPAIGNLSAPGAPRPIGLPLLWAAATCCALANGPGSWSTTAERSLANGSFEAGASRPEGWHLHGGASWPKGTAHSGEHSLTGVSKTEVLICESDTFTLDPGASYRLDGWVNCASGTARLGVEV